MVRVLPVFPCLLVAGFGLGPPTVMHPPTRPAVLPSREAALQTARLAATNPGTVPWPRLTDLSPMTFPLQSGQNDNEEKPVELLKSSSENLVGLMIHRDGDHSLLASLEEHQRGGHTTSLRFVLLGVVSAVMLGFLCFRHRIALMSEDLATEMVAPTSFSRTDHQKFAAVALTSESVGMGKTDSLEHFDAPGQLENGVCKPSLQARETKTEQQASLGSRLDEFQAADDLYVRRKAAMILSAAFGTFSAPASRADVVQGTGVATEVDEEGQKLKRLLDDEEVSLVRRLQDKVQLFDVKRGAFVALSELLKKGGAIYQADIVCVGELHDSWEDHSLQRLLLDALTYVLFLELRKGEGIDAAAPRGRTPQNLSPQKVAVGVEYFTRQQQSVLDDLIFGEGSKKGPRFFRQAVDFDKVWAFDWNIYAPLFRFCQLNKSRVVGLNIPAEVTQLLSTEGMAALPLAIQQDLPRLDLSQRMHRRRFEDMLRMPFEQAVDRMDLPLPQDGSTTPALDNMYQAQVLWDEYMAESAHNWVTLNEGRMVVLAGENHVWRDAIPDRFERIAARAGRPRKAVSVTLWHGGISTADLPRTGGDYLWCLRGAGGGAELARELAEQRKRLQGKARVFPAGFI